MQPMMTRSIALAAVLSPLLGALASYTASQLAWPNSLAAWLSAPDRATERAIATEVWPICTMMRAADSGWAQLDEDFTAGKMALSAGDWSAAIAAFKLAAMRDPHNADIENYIGYAYRRLRQLEPAFAHYQQAVRLNPRHRSAHEHLGEVYLVRGDLLKAEEHLAALDRICLIPCDEYADLKAAITAYKDSVIR
jgi:tetratricopeptide (TPR) repeat protein